MSALKLFIPAAKPHQRPVLDSACRRKLWNAGRRTGKSRAALIASTVGHGTPTMHLPGILDGANGVWVQRDFPNLRAIWREELEPRFTGPPGIDLHQSERRISIAGKGRLELRSAENIDSIRGAALDFAILDEGAYFDLGYALNDVILPALLDRRGWLLVISSPNAAHDGNQEKVTPSYFNRLCTEIASGTRPEWQMWHNRTEDNTTLSPEAIAELRAEYPPGSMTAKQELDAELLVGGMGFALPFLDWATMAVPPFDLPAHWFRFGSFDWGYNHPFSFGAWAVDEDGNTFRTHSITGRHQTPKQIAATVGATIDVGRLRYVIAGGDIWNQDRAKGIEVQPVAEQLGQCGWKLIPVAQDGKRPRKTRLDNFRRYCGWPASDERPGEPPRLRVFDTPANKAAFQGWQQMLLDPNDEETPLKVDADLNGKGGDDAYDEASYGLASRMLGVVPRTIPDVQDVTMGYDYEQQRPRKRPDPETEMERMMSRAKISPIAGRHRVPRR